MNAAVKAGNVAVIWKQDIATFTADVSAFWRNHKAIAVGLATNHEGQSTEVARIWTAHRLYAANKLRRGNLVVTQDLLTNTKHGAVKQGNWRIAGHLAVNPVETVLIPDRATAPCK